MLEKAPTLKDKLRQQEQERLATIALEKEEAAQVEAAKSKTTTKK